MCRNYDEALIGAAEETFESLAFMIPMPAEDMVDGEDVTRARARVSFTGPMTGELLLGVSTEMLPQLAANMLGLDGPSASPEQQSDALGEVLNVICGNLLPVIAGSRAVFNVGAPIFLGLVDAPPAPAGARQAASAELTLDAGWAELTLYLVQEVPAEVESEA